jgi:hypothetical protein
LDLSFARSPAPPPSPIPVELAVLLAGIATAQAASATAQAQHRLEVRAPAARLLRPASGAFHAAAAAALTRWQGG